MAYMDGVMDSENLPINIKLIVFGYSQGVSVALRWVAKRQIQCDHLILYAGGVPNELRPELFNHLIPGSDIKIIVGDQDEFLTDKRLEEERKKVDLLFDRTAKFELFQGGHELKKEIINGLP
jgi:predicted esterase